MPLETLIEDNRWSAIALDHVADRAAAATLARFSMAPGDWEISVLGCDDARVAALNGAFRGRQLATNVLSWPTHERRPQAAGQWPALPEATDDNELGDIAIAFDTCRAEAEERGLTLEDHTSHLLVHGILHLLGFDHENDMDAVIMEGLETEILASMGVSDPY